MRPRKPGGIRTDIRDKSVDILDHDKRARQAVQRYACHAARVLKQKSASTDHYAEFVALLCQQRDLIYDNEGFLCLEWMLDYYMAFLFKIAYTDLQTIWKTLILHNHHERNKYEYFDMNEAFYCSKNAMVFVFGKHGDTEPRHLVIDGDASGDSWGYHKCYVRNIWRSTKRNCIGVVLRPTLQFYKRRHFSLRYQGDGTIYGDARDPGHVLTYHNLFGVRKCDKVLWDISAPLAFFFAMKMLKKNLSESYDA